MISNKQNEDHINTDLRNNYKQRVNRIFNLYNLETGLHYHRCIYPQISASFVGILQHYLERSWWNIVRKKGFAAKHAWSDLEAAATRHKDRFICNTAESFVLSSTEKTREKPKIETFEGGTFFLCLFFFFSFSSCSFFLSLCTYSYTHAHIYICILHD